MINEIFYSSINWANSHHAKWIHDNAEQLLLQHKLDNTSNVLDIGCYTGKWISQIYSKYKCNCFALEPILEFYNLCENKNVIKYCNYGLTIEDDHFANMKVNKDESKIDCFGSQVFLKNAKSFFKENNIDFDLVQINIEGYEYELIPYMFEKNLLKNIRAIQIQFHEISNFSEFKYNSLKSRFLKSGFEIIFDYKFVWTKFIRK